jgi:signal peptidase I
MQPPPGVPNAQATQSAFNAAINAAQPFGPTPTPSTPPPPAENNSTLSNIASTFSSIFGAIFSWIIFPIAVVLILHNFVFQAYHVLGTSMAPMLQNADYLIISKVGYTGALIQRVFQQNAVYVPDRGQIVVFRYPRDPSEVFVKRVVGLPGDRIVVKDGKVTVYNKQHPDGFNPDKDYEASEATTLGDIDETVQQGNVFVIGDNRTPGGSYDSREWGELPSSYIIGNAVLRLLPLDQVKLL